jgi:hypothetical protein
MTQICYKQIYTFSSISYDNKKVTCFHLQTNHEKFMNSSTEKSTKAVHTLLSLVIVQNTSFFLKLQAIEVLHSSSGSRAFSPCDSESRFVSLIRLLHSQVLSLNFTNPSLISFTVSGCSRYPKNIFWLRSLKTTLLAVSFCGEKCTAEGVLADFFSRPAAGVV